MSNKLFFDYVQFINNSEGENLSEKIESFIKNTNICDSEIFIVGLLEPFTWYDIDFKKLDNFLESKKVKFYLFFANKIFISEKFENLVFLHSPSSLLLFSKYCLEKNIGKKIDDIEINSNFEKLFLLLINNPKPHRCLLLDGLCKSNLLDAGNYSFNYGLYEHPYIFECYDGKNKSFDLHTKKDINGFSYLNDEIVKSKSFVNLVVETFFHDKRFEFLSEKTFYNFLVKQPFLSLGIIGQNHLVKKFGFELNDEIFDYEFDFCIDINDRVDGVINNLKKIQGLNYNLLYKKIENKLDYNKNRAIDIIKRREYCSEMIDTLYFENKNYINNLNEFQFYDKH
jgi:hypothetical protein